MGFAVQVQAEDQARKGDPYMLKVCPVSGEELGTMGDPVVQVKNGREVRFCCNSCPGKYDADPKKFNAKIDALMIEDQKALYPLTTDVVTGQALPADDKIVDVVHFNRLVRLGSQDSAQTFAKSPDQYIAKLDEAVIAKQKASYPTDKCIVSGNALTSMGKPVLKVYGNRLIQFCCDNCPATFEANPLKYTPKLEKK
jgi:YHS domain-containing protein